MKNNFKQFPMLIFSAILFVGLVSLFVFFYKKINDNNQNAAISMTSWQTQADERSGIIALNRSIEQNADERAALETHFVQSSDVVPFLDTIGALATSAGVTNQIDSVDSGTDNSQLVVELHTLGNFQSIYKFLTLLENSPYQLNFLSMDLHQDSNIGPSGKIISNPDWEAVFQIQLVTFTP